MASPGGDRLLLDATIWHESKDADSQYVDACRTLVVDTAYSVAALSLTLHEVANSLGARDGRDADAVEMCRLISGRCGHAIVAPDPMLMRSAISVMRAGQDGVSRPQYFIETELARQQCLFYTGVDDPLERAAKAVEPG